MLIRFPLPVRAPDGMNAGAAAGDPPATGEAPQTGAAGGLFDEVGDEQQDAKPTTGADGKPQRPDTIPEQFWDPEKGAVRTDDLAKSWRDLRAKISRGDQNPPDKPDAYTVPKVEGLPEGLVGGEKDTLWPEIRKAAHAAGVTQKQLDAISAPLLQKLAEQAGASPEASPEARKAAVQTELAKLGPNGTQVVRDVGGWIAGLHARGVFTDAERDALRAVGTAEGVRALAKMRELSGEKPIPTDAFADDGLAQGDAERLLQEGFAQQDQGKIEKARRALAQLERDGRLIAPR